MPSRRAPRQLLQHPQGLMLRDVLRRHESVRDVSGVEFALVLTGSSSCVPVRRAKVIDNIVIDKSGDKVRESLLMLSVMTLAAGVTSGGRACCFIIINVKVCLCVCFFVCVRVPMLRAVCLCVCRRKGQCACVCVST